MLTCMMLPWMVCSALTKPLLKRFSYRTLAIGGMILAGAAYGTLSRVGMGGSLLPVVVAMVILGTGLGLTVAPLLIAAQNAVSKERLGTATSLTQFTRSMGSAVGLAVLGTLFLAPFGRHEPDGLIDFKVKHDPAQLGRDGGAARPGAASRLHRDGRVHGAWGSSWRCRSRPEKLRSSKLRPRRGSVR
jgi:MFS family permease